tara:strand:+ start:612 stop:923 length:312 start_codon:yes stop_codon:yes gene_type:complete
MNMTEKEMLAMQDSQFFAELERQVAENDFMSVQGSPMPHAIWNLMVSKRDLTLWCKIGMKPHRGWKVSDVKRYFNITGTGENLLARFMKIYDLFLPADEEADE